MKTDIVNLNVGGVKYTTTIETLTSVPESYLSALFSGRWEATRTSEGAVFIDRDGSTFRYILYYLQNKDRTFFWKNLPLDVKERHLLLGEAEYYGLEELRTHLQAEIHGAGEDGLVRLCTPKAQHAWERLTCEWRKSDTLQVLKSLVLFHVLQQPLEAEKPHLLKHLVSGQGHLQLQIDHSYTSYHHDCHQYKITCSVLVDGSSHDYHSYTIKKNGEKYVEESNEVGRGHESYESVQAVYNAVADLHSRIRKQDCSLLWLLQQDFATVVGSAETDDKRDYQITYSRCTSRLILATRRF